MRIAVGIPSYREAATIAQVVTCADRGLSSLVSPADAAIMNFDSGSDDGTVEAFLAAPTVNPKSSETVSPDAPGKGHNLIRFFERVVAGQYDIAVTLDADVTSGDPGWIAALVRPIASGEASFVTPTYRRHRFDGSTTNLFAYPFTYAWTGRVVRQPIGGDFRLSLRLVRHLLSRASAAPVGGYGIDIFMTLRAAIFDGRLSETSLGSKLHRPSFDHFEAIAREVITGAAAALDLDAQPAAFAEPLRVADAIGPGGAYRTREAALDVYRRNRRHLMIERGNVSRWLPESSAAVYRALASELPALRSGPWIAAVAEAFTGKARRHIGPEALSDLLAPILVARTITFWDEIERLDPPEVERKVVAGALRMRRAILRSSAPSPLTTRG